MNENIKRLSMQVNVDSFLPATDDEKEYMVTMRPSTTFFQDGIARLKKNKVAMVSFCIIVIITLMAIFVPLFCRINMKRCSECSPENPWMLRSIT